MNLLRLAMDKMAGMGTSLAAKARRKEHDRQHACLHNTHVPGEIIEMAYGARYVVQRNGSYRRIEGGAL